MFRVAASGVGGVIERPMMSIHLTGENRANLIGFAANCDDGVNGLMQKLVQVFRLVAGNVYADLGHRLDRERMNIARRLAAGTGDVDQIARGLAENAFGEMTAAGIAGAKDENSGFHKSEGCGP